MGHFCGFCTDEENTQFSDAISLKEQPQLDLEWQNDGSWWPRPGTPDLFREHVLLGVRQQAGALSHTRCLRSRRTPSSAHLVRTLLRPGPPHDFWLLAHIRHSGGGVATSVRQTSGAEPCGFHFTVSRDTMEDVFPHMLISGSAIAHWVCLS